jgi:isoamylase
LCAWPTDSIGSPDIHGHEKREPEQSVNFITCHDGFTSRTCSLTIGSTTRPTARATAMARTTTEAGTAAWKGPTDNPGYEKQRNRQVKNFLTASTYCRTNETSWFDWAVVDRHADVHRFVTLLNARRLLCDVEHEKERASLNEMLGRAQKAWMT